MKFDHEPCPDKKGLNASLWSITPGSHHLNPYNPFVKQLTRSSSRMIL